MPNDYFQFKQFTVWQDQCAMKVGTDGVLLGAWANMEGTQRILDVGTGTGLIALMLAQRSNARVDAIEIEEDACKQAINNIKICPWNDRIHVFQTSFQAFFMEEIQQYDLIVSNPPFFHNSLKAPDLKRTAARHSDNFPFNVFFLGCRDHLSGSGRLSIILPTEQVEEMTALALGTGLFCIRKTQILPTLRKQPVRCLLEFSKHPQIYVEDVLIIEKQTRHDYTPEYKALTKDFYLAF